MSSEPKKNKNIVAIVPPDVGPGLRLSGMSVLELSSKDEVRFQVENTLDLEEASVLILAERFYIQLPERLRDRLDDSVAPMLVTLPDTASFEETEEDHRKYVSQLIKRAIGFQIKVS